jgi:hypothetical protein
VTYEADAWFLQALALGPSDPLADDVVARLVMLRAQYVGRGDAGMMDLIRRAEDARAAALQAADVAFLQSLIDGIEDYFADDLYERLEPLHAKYQGDAAMLDLFNRAATAYGDAVVAAAQWALAGLDAVDAIDKAMGREWRD